MRGEIGLGEILRTKQSEVVTDCFEDSLFNSEPKLEGQRKKKNQFETTEEKQKEKRSKREAKEKPMGMQIVKERIIN